MYLLKFHEIYKTPLWGGHKIGPFKGVQLGGEPIGESWEISAVEGDISVVVNGDDAGMTLADVIARDRELVVGKRVWQRYGTTFPLLVKLIDACDNLSIQVHPNDELARRWHNSFGKTELWYVIDAEPGSGIYSGLSRAITPEEYVERVANNTIMDVLQFHQVKPGDVFFLPSGRIHAIGRGVFLAEIQQTSNITYRIYDYNRLDKDGKPRELHTERAKEAIDYRMYNNLKTEYSPAHNTPVEIARCPYFITSILHLDEPIERPVASFDSFVIYMCVKGSAAIEADNGSCVVIKQGETCLVPAAMQCVTITPDAEALLLESYVE